MDHFLKEGESLKRLIREYDKYGNLVIGTDFDSTLHDYHREGHTFDDMTQLVRDLRSINCKIIIWTAHCDHEYVAKYLQDRGIPYDGINTDGVKLSWETRKPFFNALLDDRAGMIQVYNDLCAVVKHARNKQAVTNLIKDAHEDLLP